MNNVKHWFSSAEGENERARHRHERGERGSLTLGDAAAETAGQQGKGLGGLKDLAALSELKSLIAIQ